MPSTLVLAGDYWHPAPIIRPLAEKLFSDGSMRFTENPKDFERDTCDLLVIFKEPSENNRIPTPVWCDENWTKLLISRVSQGMGLIVAHAGICDVKKDHPLVTELTHAVFLGHPAQCPVSVRFDQGHPLTDGLADFTLPENDEHYQVEMLPGSEGEILGRTESAHGAQPGLWAHSYGKGRVCVFTPGHTTKNLLSGGMTAAYRRMISWCAEQS